MRITIEVEDWMSTITKEVVADFNILGDQEFLNKYCCSKIRFLKRVLKYGDPYKNSPLAKFGKMLIKIAHR